MSYERVESKTIARFSAQIQGQRAIMAGLQPYRGLTLRN